MTEQEITIVEEFLISFAGPDAEVLAVKTERNSDRSKLAPKFLTYMKIKSKVTGELYLAERNTLFTLRYIKRLHRNWKPNASVRE